MAKKKKPSKVKAKGETKQRPSEELDEGQLDGVTGGATSSEWVYSSSTLWTDSTNTTYNIDSSNLWQYKR